MKQELLVELLQDRLSTLKVGLLVKGIEGICPREIAAVLSTKIERHLYISASGYGGIADEAIDAYTITPAVEKAVLWRSIPDYAGSIIVFVKNDTDKLHSLAEFDVISLRDLSRFLVSKQIKAESNTPTSNFWKALYQTSDYYAFDLLLDFVQAISDSDNIVESIPNNMWRLNLLCDKGILGTKSNPEERLAKNRELIFAIGQLSEDSRKKLSRSLTRTKPEDKVRLQKAYTQLQNLYKYGKKDTLKLLDFATVQELFSATKDSKKKKAPVDAEDDTTNNTVEDTSAPIRSKELGSLIAGALIDGDEEDARSIKELLGELKKHFDTESEENDTSIPTIGGVFNDREIVLDNHQSDLRKLVGKVCNADSWGGLMETEESVLRDAISADIKSFRPFNPLDADSMVSFKGGIDGSQPLFQFIVQFDAQFDEKEIETAERFSPIIEQLQSLRSCLLKSLDMIMYYPVLSFGADEEIRLSMIDYIDSWAKLYHAFNINEPTMRQISAGGTSFIARALLLLDVLYIKTPKEWKGVLLPLHPLYLWRYYEIFKTLPTKRAQLDEDDSQALTEVLNQLPHIMSFLIANGIVTESQEEKSALTSSAANVSPTKVSAAPRSGNASIPMARNLSKTLCRPQQGTSSAMPCRPCAAAVSSCISTTKWLLKQIHACRWRLYVNRWAALLRGRQGCYFVPTDIPHHFIKKIKKSSSKRSVHLQRVLEVDALFLCPPERRIRVLSISKYNSEGYFDPTAYGALSVIDREERSLRAFRPIVYICSPYAGDIEANVDAARRYSRFAVEQGYIPIAPHLLFPQFLNDADPKERQLGLFFGNALMSKCSEVWVFGSRISAGMEAEIERAKWKNYRLRYFTENLKEA